MSTEFSDLFYFQLEFGDEDDIDAARAKLKEWILESGYDDSYEFELAEFDDNVDEFSNSASETQESTVGSQKDQDKEIVNEKAEETEEKEKKEEDHSPEKEATEDEKMDTEEGKTVVVEEPEAENEEPQADKEPEPEMMEDSGDSNDLFKEAVSGEVIADDTDILELDYGEDDLNESKAASRVPTPEPKSVQPVEPVSTEQPTTADVEPPGNLIWISNLLKETKAEAIRDAYTALGYTDEIKTCKIAVNKKTNAAFGFVELPTAEAADKFISEYNSNELCGSIVQVSRSHLNERNNSYETMLNML